MIQSMVETMLGPLNPVLDMYTANQTWINTILVAAASIGIFRRRFGRGNTEESSS
ncbi:MULTISPECIES: hypothetical protein [Salibacterium]|uniref:Uncharacterized protein n=2 Tax=Salibacterium TaxID=1884429 RepID=A0A1I4PJT8_9BACI|nr:hypothetical protein [Salibacterium qingdaonense]SFM27836.1 hypothetical protein SAMN04488054_12727 [Salibacterium qingdaonense]